MRKQLTHADLQRTCSAVGGDVSTIYFEEFVISDKEELLLPHERVLRVGTWFADCTLEHVARCIKLQASNHPIVGQFMIGLDRSHDYVTCQKFFCVSCILPRRDIFIFEACEPNCIITFGNYANDAHCFTFFYPMRPGYTPVLKLAAYLHNEETGVIGTSVIFHNVAL